MIEKSVDISTEYLCNDKQDLEISYVIYKHIEQINYPYKIKDIENTLLIDLQKSSSLRFLRILGILEETEEGLYKKDDIWWKEDDQPITEWDFKLLILNRLIQDVNQFPYGMQAHTFLQYAYFLERKIEFFDCDDKALRSDINRYLEDKKYQPVNKEGGRITLNYEKFRFWKDLLMYLGLIYPSNLTRAGHITLDQDLLEKIIKIFIKEYGSNKFAIKDFLTFINKNFLFIPLDDTVSPPKIPSIFSQALNNLRIDNLIKFDLSGDHPEYELINVRLKPSRFNWIKVIE